MDNIFEGLAVACIYLLVIFAPLSALAVFGEHTRLGRRITDALLRKMGATDDDPKGY